jgi:phosphoglycolate phosphatase-like HAD superfamily hydrolase
MVMKKSIKRTFFFDLDGTIFNVYDRIYKVYKDILTNYGKIPLDKKEYIELKRKKIQWQTILESSNAEDILPQFLCEWMARIEDESYLRLDKVPYPKRVFLRDLIKANSLVLVTLRNRKENLIFQLKEKRIYKIFHDIIVVSAITNEEKWRIKADIIKAYKSFKRETSIIVGDTETDILAGKALGITTVAVADGMRCAELLKCFKPDFLLNDITQISEVIKNDI